VRAIANIGIAHGQLGRYQEAVRYIRRGIALAHEVGIVQLEGKARKELGIVLFKMRHHDKAVAELRQALTLLRHVGYRPQEAETLVALGNALSAQGLADAADDAWRQSLRLFSTFRLPTPLAGDQRSTDLCAVGGRPVVLLGGGLPGTEGDAGW
jgi:tetratricopeptide (TPR) repeat protein